MIKVKAKSYLEAKYPNCSFEAYAHEDETHYGLDIEELLEEFAELNSPDLLVQTTNPKSGDVVIINKTKGRLVCHLNGKLPELVEV
jgi:myo-inositol-hexaphosphate 3-phosphohydrolase